MQKPPDLKCTHAKPSSDADRIGTMKQNAVNAPLGLARMVFVPEFGYQTYGEVTLRLLIAKATALKQEWSDKTK
ncbi:hypothetical protein BESB_011980 [Besnoitia besnoiti]|uniref:Uncharacterized protein n=1 Tax=Besnoitia besnoiti TaxID=94643 RepID=A0A2A9M9J4_BESBE|nr:hypothetical protein BESB_011980 [Besnoitia besnoiti]PFH32586.1 hypothetical protein BESB_011980 [Besnoitia besnoiti]